MARYAIKDGSGAVIRVDELAQSPGGSAALISPWLGVPAGGMAGRVLRESGGALYWHSADASAAWAEVRARRDALLRASDWVAVLAVEQSAAVPTAWATYRQALRDITQQADPFGVQWPSAPT